MCFKSLAIIVLLAAAASAQSAPTPQAVRDSAPSALTDSTPRNERAADHYGRFYNPLSFGSEREFNPLSDLVNDGFDILQTSSQDRHVFRRDYAGAAKNVLESVLHAGRTYSTYGWKRALRNEWLPLTLDNNTGGGAWVPNYEYHLFGSGMVALKMEEWFADHDVPHPMLASAIEFMSMQFLNEVTENGPARGGLNEDATTDLLIFDPGALLLWRWGAMQRLFSGPVELTNWPAQPIIDAPSGTLENAGQEYVLRVPIPHVKSWRLFYYFEMTSLLGVSHQLPNGASLSLAGGLDAVDNPVVDARTGAKGATLRPKGGIFYDREGSLLWSIQFGSRSGNATVDVNVYPGIVRVGGFSPGVVFQVPKTGGPRVGIVAPIGIGLGHGPER